MLLLGPSPYTAPNHANGPQYKYIGARQLYPHLGPVLILVSVTDRVLPP